MKRSQGDSKRRQRERKRMRPGAGIDLSVDAVMEGFAFSFLKNSPEIRDMIERYDDMGVNDKIVSKMLEIVRGMAKRAYLRLSQKSNGMDAGSRISFAINELSAAGEIADMVEQNVFHGENIAAREVELTARLVEFIDAHPDEYEAHMARALDSFKELTDILRASLGEERSRELGLNPKDIDKIKTHITGGIIDRMIENSGKQQGS